MMPCVPEVYNNLLILEVRLNEYLRSYVLEYSIDQLDNALKR